MIPYTERFDDFKILTLRFTILRNCPNCFLIFADGKESKEEAFKNPTSSTVRRLACYPIILANIGARYV